MIFRQLNAGRCRTYLVGSDRTHEVVLVDPLRERVDAYLKVIAEHGLKLRWVIDTHTHSDHLSGGALIHEKTGVDYLMHFTSASTCASKRLRERDALGLGELTLTFLHVPGHTPDSIIIRLPDRILSGDFLLLGGDGAGRLDLPGAEVRSHHKNLAKIIALPDDLLVFPAHADPKRDHSELRHEWRVNPVLQLRTLEEYAAWWSSRRLGPAPWAESVTAINESGSAESPDSAPPEEGETGARRRKTSI